MLKTCRKSNTVLYSCGLPQSTVPQDLLAPWHSSKFSLTIFYSPDFFFFSTSLIFPNHLSDFSSPLSHSLLHKPFFVFQLIFCLPRIPLTIFNLLDFLWYYEVGEATMEILYCTSKVLVDVSCNLVGSQFSTRNWQVKRLQTRPYA